MRHVSLSAQKLTSAAPHVARASTAQCFLAAAVVSESACSSLRLVLVGPRSSLPEDGPGVRPATALGRSRILGNGPPHNPIGLAAHPKSCATVLETAPVGHSQGRQHMVDAPTEDRWNPTSEKSLCHQSSLLAASTSPTQ